MKSLTTLLSLLALGLTQTLPASDNDPGFCVECHCQEDNCGTIPFPTTYHTPKFIIHSPKVWSFVSEPNLHPMKVRINRHEPDTSLGLIFVAPYTSPSFALYGQSGALILDNEGEPVWFKPLDSPNLENID